MCIWYNREAERVGETWIPKQIRVWIHLISGEDFKYIEGYQYLFDYIALMCYPIGTTRGQGRGVVFKRGSDLDKQLLLRIPAGPIWYPF